MITVHHLGGSRSHRILWLLEELGLDYEVQVYQRDPQTGLAPDALRQVHRLGKAPLITDGELVLPESGAIIEYLLRRYGRGRLQPAEGSPEALRHLYWMHYAEGSIMPALLLQLMSRNMRKGRRGTEAQQVVDTLAFRMEQRSIHPLIHGHLSYMNDALADTGWFVGEHLTAADIHMSFPVEWGMALGVVDERYPRLLAYRERCKQTETYKRAQVRGGTAHIPPFA